MNRNRRQAIKILSGLYRKVNISSGFLSLSEQRGEECSTEFKKQQKMAKMAKLWLNKELRLGFSTWKSKNFKKSR